MLEAPLIGFVPAGDRDALRGAMIEQHLSGLPVEDLDRFARAKRVRLGEAVLSRVRVYLDTNFWINLRHAAAGRPPSAAHGELLEVLRAMVSAGTAICPLAEPALLELLKQPSRDARIACARLMDELSGGVALQPHRTRLKAELLHFVYRSRQRPVDIHPFEQMAWTRAIFVFGDAVPVPEAPELDNDTVRASFDDFAWTFSLEEIVSGESPSTATALDLSDLARRLTEGKVNHANDLRTFRNAYKAEVAGTVDAYGDIIDGVMPYLYERETGSRAPAEDVGRGDPRFRNLIATVLYKDPKRRELPTLNIQAGIHAAMRWDRDRKFKPTDWLDFIHATAALPYCSMFLTDRSLARLVTSGLLDYGNQYGCRVECDATRAIETLVELTSRPRPDG
jgi:hypothetical protein